MNRPRLHSQVALLGVRLDAVDLDGAVREVVSLMASRTLAHVVTANLDYMSQLGRDAELAGIVERADLVVADGVPLLWMARWSGQWLPGRVNGTDLVVRLLAASADHGWPVALLGGDPGVAKSAARQAEERWSTPVAGVWRLSPEEVADPDVSRRIAGEVGALGAPLVLVALGAGRQDRWIESHRESLGKGVVVGVGSALDFVAGTRRRAPVLFQRLGLEWLWRMMLEPGRLWRRYLIEDLGLLARFAISTASGRSRGG